MPIVHLQEDRFPHVDRRSVWRLHRLGAVFGLVFPLLIFLAGALRSGHLGIWPTPIIHLYEHTYLTGWIGLYVLGLLAFVAPTLLDRQLSAKDQEGLSHGMNWYVVGSAIIIVGGLLSESLGGFHPWLSAAGWVGGLVMLFGWVRMQYGLFRWYNKAERRTDIYLYAAMAGMVFFMAALLLQIVLDLLLWSRGQHLMPQAWMFPLRVLPIVGIGLMLLSFLLRLAPEMLGWRPLLPRRMKHMYTALLVAALLFMIGYPAYHQLGDLLAALTYGLGAFLGLIAVVWMFLSIDLWQVRLTPAMSTEHILPIYSSLAWLLFAAGYMLVGSVWELKHGQALLPLWTEPLMYAIVAGFFMQGVFGLYTYVVNELPGAHRHGERLMMVVSVLVNWTLLLRVFIYPFMVAFGWEGALPFRYVLDALLYISILLASADLFHALGGHQLIWRASSRKD